MSMPSCRSLLALSRSRTFSLKFPSGDFALPKKIKDKIMQSKSLEACFSSMFRSNVVPVCLKSWTHKERQDKSAMTLSLPPPLGSFLIVTVLGRFCL